MDYNFIYGVQTAALYGIKDAVKKSGDKEIWREIANQMHVSLEDAPYVLVGMDPKTEETIWSAKNSIAAIEIIKYTMAVCDLVTYALNDTSDKFSKLKALKQKYFGNLEALKDDASFIQDLKNSHLLKTYTKNEDNVFISEDGTIYIPVKVNKQILEYILKFLKIVFLGDDYKPLLLKLFLNFSNVPEFQESEWYTDENLRLTLLTCAALIDTNLQSIVPIEIDPETLIKFGCVSIYVDVAHRLLIHQDVESGKYIQELYSTDTLKHLLDSGAFMNLNVKDNKILFDGKSYSRGV